MLDLSIPASVVKDERIEFYISATDDLGITRHFPLLGADDPIFIPLIGLQQQVLFLHGIMGSQLFEYDDSSNNEIRRWLSFTDTDVNKLELDTNGISVNEIYTKEEAEISGDNSGLIAEDPTYETNIYKTFIKDKFIEGDKERIWDFLVYDWRLDFDDKMKMKPYGDVCTADETDKDDNKTCTKGILDALRRKIIKMSAKDPDGKIDIVAHSMGGLLSKYYVSKYSSDTKIGKLILVDSPQLGTAAGAAVVMHGEHSLGGSGFGKVSKETLRHVTQNMISSFYLTPSSDYFQTSVISAKDDNSSPLFYTKKIVKKYCADKLNDSQAIQAINEFDLRFKKDGINSWNEWSEFISNPGEKISTSDISDTKRPLSKEIDGYNRIGTFINGSNMHQNHIGGSWDKGDVDKVYQIVGENLITPVGIKYEGKATRFNGCSNFTYELIEKPIGDGTVVRESQEALDVPTYYIDLYNYNCDHVDKSHSSILEVEWTRNQIDQLLDGKEDLVVAESDKCGGLGNIPITSNKPSDIKIQWVKFKIKSPVEVHVYDSFGNHTGPTPQGYETRISNSTYHEVGSHKYVSLPIGYDDLVVEFRGLDMGTFSLTIERYDHTELIQTLDYFDVPVTKDYRGRILFKQFSDIVNIENDNDGDGTYENSTSPISSIEATSTGAYYLEGRYRALASLNIQANPVAATASGWLKFSTADASGRKLVMISQVDLVQPDTEDQITIKAPCTLNNQADYKCTVSLFDGGIPGANKDFFSIVITGPNDFFYQSSGTLSGGGISLTVQ